MVGYDKTGASLEVSQLLDSFISIQSLQSGEIINTSSIIFDREADHSIFINLKGHEW